MNILMLGSDDTNLVEKPSKKNEYVRYRHIQYAKYVNSLHIALKTLRADDLKIRHHSDRLTCYPTLSSNRIIGLIDLYIMGKRIIQKNNIDLIVTGDPFGPGLIGYLLKKRFNLPICVQMFGDHVFNDNWKNEKLRNRLLGWCAKYLFKKADSIRVMSERFKKIIINKLGINGKKIFIFPIFVRKDSFLTLSLHSNSIRDKYKSSGFSHIILFVGRLVPQKDLFILLKAAQFVLKKYPHVLFCLVGDGPLRNELENEAKSLKTINNISFEGEVAQGEIPKYYNASDIFVLSSIYEDTARVLIEAACSAKPIVTTDTTGARDVVVNEKNGFVVDVGDYKQLSEKLIILLSNPRMAKEFGKAGRKYIADKFSDKNIIDGIISMWKHTIKTKNA